MYVSKIAAQPRSARLENGCYFADSPCAKTHFGADSTPTRNRVVDWHVLVLHRRLLMLFRHDVVARNRRVTAGPRHGSGFLLNVFDLVVVDLFTVTGLRTVLDLFRFVMVVRMNVLMRWLQRLWGMMSVMVLVSEPLLMMRPELFRRRDADRDRTRHGNVELKATDSSHLC